MRGLALVLCALLASCRTSASKPEPPAAGPGQAVKKAAAKKAKHPDIESLGGELELACSLDRAWSLVSKVEDWGVWNSHVSSVEPGLGLGAGAVIAWSWDDTEVKSTVVAVRNGREFSFRTTAASKRVLMHWTFEKKGSNAVKVALKAEVPYGTAHEIMEKLREEVKDWLAALEAAALK